MTPGPNLQEIIDTVKADASSAEPLDQLATASRTVAELEVVGDSVLSHFVDQCRRRGRSWSEISTALGVSKQAAHKRFSFTAAAFESGERLTERARSALRSAAEDARMLGHGFVGTEHLLLGLFEPARGVAAQILGELGFTRAAVEEQVLAAVPRGSSTDPEPPLTPRASGAVSGAVSEALSLGHNYVGTEHLLLALFGDPDGVAAKILGDGGAVYDDLRDRVVQKLSGYTKPAH
jgi:hypothetical protein